jgi:Fe-S-cluster containining protein
VYCKTCKDYLNDEHICYMLPVVNEVKQSKSDSKENNNYNRLYPFFDFECTQDDLIQCENGYQREQNGLKCVNCEKSKCGIYEHRPNLCVAHKVCLNCYDKEVTPNSTCEHCGQNEMVFAGSNTTDKFCKWLTFGRNNGATVLCHNFK